MKTKQTTGMYFHCHHDKLCEYVYNYKERVNYIKKYKPEKEIEIRLRLFKPVKDVKSLSKEFVEVDKKWWEASNKREEADKKWEEADKKWKEADKKGKKVNKKWKEADKKWWEAYKKWKEADNKQKETYKKNLPELETLHKKECGCENWNSNKQELEFKGVEK